MGQMFTKKDLLVVSSQGPETFLQLRDLVIYHSIQLSISNTVTVYDNAFGQTTIDLVVLLQRRYNQHKTHVREHWQLTLHIHISSEGNGMRPGDLC